jgi:hypothetical protein
MKHFKQFDFLFVNRKGGSDAEWLFGASKRCNDKKSGSEQGCQMVYFQTKNPNLGKFWRASDLKCRYI